jgi:hypothetical protein
MTAALPETRVPSEVSALSAVVELVVLILPHCKLVMVEMVVRVAVAVPISLPLAEFR